MTNKERENAFKEAVKLLELTVKQDLKGRKKTVGKIEEIWDKFKDDREISLKYAASLVNLTAKQDLKGRKETVGKLKKIWSQFGDDEKISLAYAKSLFNLSNKQDLEGRKETVGEIKIIWDNFGDDEKISLEYAKSLFNLSFEQDLEGIKEAVGKIEEIWDNFNDNREISLAYAKSLFNLTIEQDLEGRKETVGKLEEIWDKFKDDREISLNYAASLVNLTVKQDLEGRKETVGKIEEIWDKFKDDREISLAYAKSLFNLSAEQDLEGIKETVGKLEKIWDKFKGDREISLNYAGSLVDLTIKQDLEGIKETVGKIEEIWDKFGNDREISLQYAKSLFNLSLEQDLEGIKETVGKIEKIWDKFKGDREISLIYAMSLFNLTFEQDLEGIKETVGKLEEIWDKFKDDREINLVYAKSLVRLSFVQDLEGIKKTTGELENIARQSKGNRRIAFLYVTVLINLVNKMGASETLNLEEKLNEFTPNYSTNEMIPDDFISVFIARLLKVEEDRGELIFLFVSYLIDNLRMDRNSSIFFDLVDLIGLYFKEKDGNRKALGNYLNNLIKIYRASKSILHELSIKEDEKNEVRLYHYTKIDILHKFLDRVKKNRVEEYDKKIGNGSRENSEHKENKDDGKFWMFNANYMNDPMEGKTFLQMLRKGIEERGNPLLELEYYNAPNIFFASFSSEEDILPMWQQYGGSCEGCSIRFENNFDCAGKETDHVLLFEIRNEKENEAFSQDKINAPQEITQKEEKIFLYHICYIDQKDTKDIYYIDGKEVKESKVKEERTIVNDIIDIKEAIKAIETLKENDNDGIYKNDYKDIMLCLDKVRYLFKSVDYMYEKEIRLLKQVRIDDKEIQSIQIGEEAAPRLYFVNPKKIKVEEIVLGPKVKDTDILVPYIFYCDKEIKVKKSSINFR